MKYIKTYENLEGFTLSLDEMIKLADVENNDFQSKKIYFEIIDPYMMEYLRNNKKLLEEPEEFKWHSKLAYCYDSSDNARGILFIDTTHPYFRKYRVTSEEKFQVQHTNTNNNLRCTNSYSSAYFTIKDMEDFLDYMRNPKLYDEMKKYNL